MFTLLWVYREGPMGACVGKGCGDRYLFWGPTSPSPPRPLHSSCQFVTRENETGPQGQPAWLLGCVNSGRTLGELIPYVCCGLIHHWPSNLRIWLSPEGQMSKWGVRAIFPVHWPAPVGWWLNTWPQWEETPLQTCLWGIQRWVHWLMKLGAGDAASRKQTGAMKRGVWVQLSQNDGSMQQDTRPWWTLFSSHVQDRQECSPSRVFGRMRGDAEKALTHCLPTAIDERWLFSFMNSHFFNTGNI